MVLNHRKKFFEKNVAQKKASTALLHESQVASKLRVAFVAAAAAAAAAVIVAARLCVRIVVPVEARNAGVLPECGRPLFQLKKKKKMRSLFL